MKKETIAAVVVTYNRKDLLKECLDSLLKQTQKLDSIIIMDNASSDGTKDMLKKEYLSNKIFDYVNLGKNLGGAGGFHYGIKRAYEKGFDWIWVMDDDALPLKNCLKNLSKKFNKNNIISPIKINKKEEIQTDHFGNISKHLFLFKSVKSIKEDIKIDFTSFVGPIFKKNVIKSVGYPNKKFFIWADDFEYCIRLKNKRFKILLTPFAKIIHEEGFISKYEFTWKNFYGWRNKIFIRKKYLNKFFYFIYLVYFTTYILMQILFFKKEKKKFLKLYFKSLNRAINSNFIVKKNPKDVF
ncbi:MAG: glycosyltransferase family 2 protein [archaeon]